MIRRPPRSTLDRSSAASDVYKRQEIAAAQELVVVAVAFQAAVEFDHHEHEGQAVRMLSLIHISEPTRPY